jgi:hypothetical protein
MHLYFNKIIKKRVSNDAYFIEIFNMIWKTLSFNRLYLLARFGQGLPAHGPYLTSGPVDYMQLLSKVRGQGHACYGTCKGKSNWPIYFDV